MNTYLYRTHARSIKGQIIFGKICGRQYQKVSLVAGHIGKHTKSLIAPLIYHNTMTSDLFEAWFKQMLDNLAKQSIIILDNTSFHRMKHLQELANASQYKYIILVLPPYSKIPKKPKQGTI